jgi:hypothetical protein
LQEAREAVIAAATAAVTAAAAAGTTSKRDLVQAATAAAQAASDEAAARGKKQQAAAALSGEARVSPAGCAAGPDTENGGGGGGAGDALPTWEQCAVRGQWEKDEARCDSEKELFDVMELSWVFTQAAKLLRNVEIQQVCFVGPAPITSLVLGSRRWLEHRSAGTLWAGGRLCASVIPSHSPPRRQRPRSCVKPQRRVGAVTQTSFLLCCWRRAPGAWQDAKNFTIITAASVITISEVYPLSSAQVSQNRRDMRAGAALGTVRRVAAPAGPGVQVSLRFQGYPEGQQDETFSLEGPNTLVRETSLLLDNGKSWRGKSIYKRVR